MSKIWKYLMEDKNNNVNFDVGKFIIQIGFFTHLEEEINKQLSKSDDYIIDNYYEWHNMLISTTYYITNALDFLIMGNINKKYDYPEQYKKFKRIRKMWTHPITNYDDGKNEMTSPVYSFSAANLPRIININKYESFPEKTDSALTFHPTIKEDTVKLCLSAIKSLEDILSI